MSRFSQAAPPSGFGWNQYINFGKHKGKTYYDLSNIGDYKYLDWCLRNDAIHAKNPTDFYISDTCIDHIRACLSVDGYKTTPWTKEFSEPDENGKIILRYVCRDIDPMVDKTFTGPPIEMKKCPNCNQIKTFSLFNVEDGVYCRKCYVEMDLKRTTQVRVNQEIENRKGSRESYIRESKPPRAIYSSGSFRQRP